MKNLLISAVFLVLAGCAALNAPPNLAQTKAALYEYHDSGAYDRDVAALFAKAKSHMHASKVVSKPAIVMDIDETSLSNWPELKANDLTFKLEGPCNHLPKGPCGLDAYHKHAASEAIAPALDFFREAKAQNIAVFFITGRREFLRNATITNLKRAGYKNWDGLILRPVDDKRASAADYKTPARKAIEAKGYTIIATIGDQKSDLEGGHRGKTFLVPNPFYGLP
jgi:predicted secreted acid phosphatase